MPGSDPGALAAPPDAAEWLAAAATELAHARGGAGAPRRPPRRDARAARRRHGLERGAGRRAPVDDRYGRSYMEHVVALAQAPRRRRGGIPDDVRAAARLLRDTPAPPPDLITIGKPDMAPLERARAIARLRPSGYVSENG